MNDKIGPIERTVLVCLCAHGVFGASGVSAGEVGAFVWRGVKRGRSVPSRGGGDYAAQMLLGRMRKKGLVRTCSGEGSSRWEATEHGRKLFAQDTFG